MDSEETDWIDREEALVFGDAVQIREFDDKLAKQEEEERKKKIKHLETFYVILLHSHRC